MISRFSNRVVSIVLSLALVLTGISFDSLYTVQAAFVVPQNYLSNGDFTEGMNGWSIYALNSNATAKVNSEYELEFSVNWWDYDQYGNCPDWQDILIHSLSLEGKKTYTLQFDAYASEDRVIESLIKGQNYNQKYNITTSPQTYSYTFTTGDAINSELQFYLGKIENGTYNVPAGANKIYFSNMYIVEGDGSDIVSMPVITGVTDQTQYLGGVQPGVKYNGDYTVSLYYGKNESDNKTIINDYKLGDAVTENGYYTMTVMDTLDANLQTSVSFSIDSTKIDMSKDYYIIKSRSNGMVLTAGGYKDGSPVTQDKYAQKLTQYFTIEKNGTYNVYRSLATGLVVGVENASKLNSANIVLSESVTSSTKWLPSYRSQGYYALINLNSSKVLDVPGATGSQGAQLDQYESNGSNAQQWDVIKIDISSAVDGQSKPDTSSTATWKINAINYPEEDKLVAAGPIYVKWYNDKAIGNVVSYKLNFDNENTVTVAASDEEIMEYKWYNTVVSSHTLTITAVLSDGSTISSDERTFYLSKKGLGWGSLYRTQDMNLSWYYQWSMDESAGTSSDLQFVPMVWGNWGSEWLNNPDNACYKTVLGFNEPDFNEQSALTVEDALKAWADFSNSDLRVGSPCTAIGAYWSQDWFWKFMDGIEADDNLRVDFITIHCYVDSGDPNTLLELIDKTWEKWHKPIWITEFGVAKWGTGNDIWNYNTEGAYEKVYAFMEKVLPELDKREYVERYAWFPFDPNDAYGGASGIFNYDTGELNELGKLYANSGMPEGYDYVKYSLNPPTSTKNDTKVTSSFNKNQTVKIKKAVKKKSSKKLKITLSKKIKGAGGYLVKIYKTKKNANKNKKAILSKIIRKNITGISLTSAKFRNKKILFVRVKAFAKINGKRVYSKKWSNIYRVKIS